MLKKVLFFFILFFFFSAFRVVNAQDYQTDYQVEYSLDKSASSQNTNVKFNIAITNLNNDVYVKKFSIVFPKTFSIRNIKALDDNGEVAPQINQDDLNTTISLEFTDPKTGTNSVNHFYLDFWQDNLFKDNGKSWELIIPTIEDKTDIAYKIIVHIPRGADKYISIAKPNPSSVSEDQVVWDNPKSKTIYALFGDTQYFKVDLTYHLKNPRLFPIITELALPPDTAYQKIVVGNINPSPLSTYVDQDGNYLARYSLPANGSTVVNYSGFVALSVAKRPEFTTLASSNFDNLNTQNKYWKLTATPQLDSLKNISDIYSFTTNTLKYNYNKKFDSATRLGAQEVLTHPNQAVCVEFSDLFIALARRIGIPAREIEGYGFSQDARLRPLSLISDVLHSWPEYYDVKKGTWIPVDPTWQNTSGIDYFSSFDLNHIVFAIHGKQPDYPLAAGLYKIENSQDINVVATSQLPAQNTNVDLSDFKLPAEIISGQQYELKLKLTNNGNVYVYGGTLRVDAPDLTVTPKNESSIVLAPLQQKEYTLLLKSTRSQFKPKSSITISYNGFIASHKEFKISPFYYAYALKGAMWFFIILGGVGFIFVVKKIT